MDVKVIEKYQLSEQYTAEKLMDLYKDSILEELKNYSLMEYNLLRSAKMEFTGDSHLLLTLENTIIAQTRSHEIVEFLEKVVCERCGLDLSVELAFEEPKESKHKKNSDLQIQFEIKNILKRVQLHEESAPANLLQEIMQETRTEREKIRLVKKNSAKNMMADPTVDIKNQITRMCSTEKILKMRRSQSRRLSGRWERLRYAVRS